MRFRFAFSAFFALAAMSALAQDLKVEKYHLANGMTVILHEDHSLPSVTLNLWFRVGSKDEAVHRTGFAHLFEHLMFMGTKRVPTGQFDAIMEGGGGSNNATTSSDRTDYYDSGPSNLLPTLLWLEADRLEALGTNIDQKKLDLQREVVKNERRQSYENQPYGNAELEMDTLLFPEGHPYHIDTIGLPEDLNAATVSDVKEFFAAYYVPNNVSMVVAGDFKPAEVKPMIENLFGSLPRQNDPVHRDAPDATLAADKNVTFVDDKISEPKLRLAYHSPKIYTQGDANANILASILGDGVSSRLYRRLVTETGLATAVAVYQDSRQLGSVLQFDITGVEGADLGRIQKETDAVLAELLAKGPSEAEVKRQATKYEVAALNQLQQIGNRAELLNEYETYFGEPNSEKRVLDQYRTATAASVLATGRAILGAHRVAMRVIPASPPAPAKSARDEQPAVGGNAAFALPRPTNFRLPNGVNVVYWQRPELPLVEARWVFPGGREYEDREMAGVMSLAAEWATQGEGAYDSVAFQNALDKLGASFSTSVDRGFSQASLSVLARNLSPALALATGALTQPKFDTKDWKRIYDTRMADLKEVSESAQRLAPNVALRELYGAGTLYGLPNSGTLETLAKAKPADGKAAFEEAFRVSAPTIYAAGSLSPAAFEQALAGAYGATKFKQEMRPQHLVRPNYAPSSGMRLLIVDKPKSVQTVVRFAMPAPAVGDPRRLRLQAISTIFGGLFTSRLNHNLREDKGYTYGAGSGFQMDRVTGSFVAGASVRADVTGASLKEFFKEFAAIRGGDITDAEMAKAAASLRTYGIQKFEGLGGLVSAGASTFMLGLPFESLAEPIDQSGKLKAADLNALVRDAMPLERSVLVLVGDKETILKQIEGMDLPKPEFVKP